MQCKFVFDQRIFVLQGSSENVPITSEVSEAMGKAQSLEDGGSHLQALDEYEEILRKINAGDSKVPSTFHSEVLCRKAQCLLKLVCMRIMDDTTQLQLK